MFSLQQGNRVDELEINHEAAYLNTQAGRAFLFCPRATQERVWDTRMQGCVWREHPRRPYLMQKIQPGPGDVWVIPQSAGAALMLCCVSNGSSDADTYPQERTFHRCDQPSLQPSVSSNEFERFGGRSIREQDRLWGIPRTHPTPCSLPASCMYNFIQRMNLIRKVRECRSKGTQSKNTILV